MVSWNPPTSNSWEINFYVAVRKTFSLAAAVCSNAEGHLHFAWTKSLPPCGPLVGKARAVCCSEGSFLQRDCVIFEGDSKSVIDGKPG